MVSPGRIEVLCDGSATRVVGGDPLAYHRGDEEIGRVVVVVPARDLGLVERPRPVLATDSAEPAGVGVHDLAIAAALKVCRLLGLADCVVLSSAEAAVRRARRSQVELAPQRRLQPARGLLDEIVRYGRVAKQNVRLLEPRDAEIVHLLETERCYFSLSASPLWASVTRDENPRPPRAGGHLSSGSGG